MKIELAIQIHIEGAEPDKEEIAMDIAEAEARKYAASLADALEAHGVTDVQISLDDSDAA